MKQCLKCFEQSPEYALFCIGCGQPFGYTKETTKLINEAYLCTRQHLYELMVDSHLTIKDYFDVTCLGNEIYYYGRKVVLLD